MYLFTMVFILLVVLGLFTEVVMMQNFRQAEQRTGGAQHILSWHGAVVNAARFTTTAQIPGAPTPAGLYVFNNPTPQPNLNVIQWGAPGTPCALGVFGQSIAGVVSCRDERGANPARLEALVVNRTGPPVVVNFLPRGYDLNQRFNSIILTEAGGVRLAITYIGPDITTNRADTPIAPVGLSLSQLFRQLRRFRTDPMTFGYVVNGTLQPAAQMNTTDLNGAPTTIVSLYTLPASLVNSVANPTGPVRNGALVLFTPL